jgi:hypothetical protein
MVSYPIEIRRCQHIRTNGTQCGSPALRGGKYCHFHANCRVKTITVNAARRDSSPVKVVLPVLEDASSIQFAVRQVTELILRNKIDAKQAGLLLYALQIASSNLRQMKEEKPRPMQIVVDRKKVGETPLGMTPWAAEDGERAVEDANDESYLRQAEESEEMTREAEDEMEHMRSWGRQAAKEIHDFIRGGAHDVKHEQLVHLLNVIEHQVEETILGIDPYSEVNIQACAEVERGGAQRRRLTC